MNWTEEDEAQLKLMQERKAEWEGLRRNAVRELVETIYYKYMDKDELVDRLIEHANGTVGVLLPFVTK